MKKAIQKSVKKRSSEAGDVEAYLAKVAEPARSTLEKLRATIRSVVPAEATEGLSYGMPAFHYKGALVAYAAFSSHCSFFPMQASLIDEMKDELTGRGERRSRIEGGGWRIEKGGTPGAH